MVDVERVQSLLSRITDRLRILDEYAAADQTEVLGDRRSMGDLKYTFQTAIEACTDLAQHVVASEGLAVPSSNADAFRSLAGAGMLSDDLGTTMAGAVGFRNVLVHGYADVNEELVVENLSRLDDLRSFVTAMTRQL